MSNRYEIEAGTNAVRVYYGDSEVAGLYQPNWPNGVAWESSEQASEWAVMFIESIEDESAPYAPGGPGEDRTPKATQEEIDAMLAQMEPPIDEESSE